MNPDYFYLIVGLGNPGEKYEISRHNAGFIVLQELSTNYMLPIVHKEHKAKVGVGMIYGHRSVLAQPQTFMNLSGESVKELMEAYKIPAERLIVVYDDVDLPLGRLRVRESGGAGGHNGMKSIIESIGTENFMRIRIGVGPRPEEEPLSDFVLKPMHILELRLVNLVKGKAVDCIEKIIQSGGSATTAMNYANGIIMR